MPPTYSEELIWTETADGLEHAGMLWRPSEPRPDRLPVVWIHGAGGTFTTRPRVEVMRILAARGHAGLYGHNRGHNMGAALARRGAPDVLGGVWWEKVSESHLDVAAWIDHAAGLGFPRVVLAGISYGAAKIAMYQSERNDPRVAALLLAAGPIWMYKRIRTRTELLESARQMVAEGRGQDLLPWGSFGAGFTTVSAATMLDRLESIPDLYGFADPDNPTIGRVTCPIFAFFGTNEPDMGTASDLDLIRRAARSAARVETAMIDGPDHSWRGHERAVADVVAGWLAELA